MSPRDSYPGRATASKTWWLFVACVGFFGFGGALTGWNAKTLPAAGVVCLGALAGGMGLRQGANTSYTAADHAYEGARRLDRGGVDDRVFGDFAAAKAFSRAVSETQARHVSLITKHYETLGSVGDKAHEAMSTFADMEGRNAADLQAVTGTEF
ncbi:DUF2563 family protein [Mycolicibacterium helvum]|nr:DUF2563 family protein [Mycolicibacterium helvum]